MVIFAKKLIKSGRGILAAMGLMLVLGLFAACVTNAPVGDSTSFPADSSTYTILGRVSIEGASKANGYMKLLEEAQRKYPNCDDVVNIVVDAHATFFQKMFGGGNYNLSGIAIDYKDM
ncbi:MAG: hypothetical protein ILP18_00050 [Treponema sp.]|nr:hypothetical protein [Treponema sp.]